MTVIVARGRRVFPDGIDQLVERRKTTLTAAQVLALFTTPQVLVPAPGVGRAIDVISITATVNYGTTPYTGANNLQVSYTNAAGVVMVAPLPNTWLNSSASASYKADAVAANAVTLNAPVVISALTANPGAGDSTVTFDVHYRNVNLP